MNRFIGIILLTLMPLLTFAVEDNVVITRKDLTVQLNDKNGKLNSVKFTENTTFLANRVDDATVDFTPYNDTHKINKASAPDAQPEYRQNINEGLFYDDSRLCFLPIKLKKGKPVKSTFVTTETDPNQFADIRIFGHHDIKEYIVTIEVPAALAGYIDFASLNFPESATSEVTTDKNGGKTYTYKFTDVKKFKSESLAPDWGLVMPRIVMTGYFANVGDLYTHLHHYISDESADIAPVKALADSLTAGYTDPMDKIARIATWVRRNIRYIGIEHGEYGQRPDAAASVLKKRYGDCKGSANLIKHMLRSQGIDGRLVWIAFEDHSNIPWDKYPSLACGNHMIAAAVLPDTILYLDGTSTYASPRHIPAALQGQSAMVEDGDKCMVLNVPRLPAATNSDVVRATYALDDGALVGNFEHTVSGELKKIFDALYHSTATQERNNRFASMLSTSTSTVDDIKVDLESPLDETMRFSYRESNKKPVKSAGRAVYVDLQPLQAFLLHKVDEEDRLKGIHLDFAYNTRFRGTLALPENTESVDLPQAETLETPWFRYSVTYSHEGDSVVCDSEFEILNRDATLAEVPEWNNAMKKLSRAASKRIKINLL